MPGPASVFQEPKLHRRILPSRGVDAEVRTVPHKVAKRRQRRTPPPPINRLVHVPFPLERVVVEVAVDNRGAPPLGDVLVGRQTISEDPHSVPSRYLVDVADDDQILLTRCLPQGWRQPCCFSLSEHASNVGWSFGVLPPQIVSVDVVGHVIDDHVVDLTQERFELLQVVQEM
eukprot:CAMPEP_0175999818 /NCGR_PEP_ID=MMETSP0108-20121206/57484_1 /TAXON_ID=195067 ORGANISM="Goniomonas pacifica, Strain CCMP1869" /NCGR_SAMPLE_ID=MMETSP0108 /ASSEMBLY_ACC=CAM_ASM_000204 /LENGTH=172 /DNA_ID=CAMNT_0017332265 /DNA_START=505 /DNA_END=1023 /DNA_ORIENTATION=-